MTLVSPSPSPEISELEYDIGLPLKVEQPPTPPTSPPGRGKEKVHAPFSRGEKITCYILGLALYGTADAAVNSDVIPHLYTQITADRQCGDLDIAKIDEFKDGIIHIALDQPEGDIDASQGSRDAAEEAAAKHGLTMLPIYNADGMINDAQTPQQPLEIVNAVLQPVDVKVHVDAVHTRPSTFPGPLEALGVDLHDELYQPVLQKSTDITYLNPDKFTLVASQKISSNILYHYSLLPIEFIHDEGIKDVFVVDINHRDEKEDYSGLVIEEDPSITILTDEGIDTINNTQAEEDVLSHEGGHTNAKQTYNNMDPPCEFTKANPINFSYIGRDKYLDVINGKETLPAEISRVALTKYGLVSPSEEWAENRGIAFSGPNALHALNSIILEDAPTLPTFDLETTRQKLQNDPRIQKLAVTLAYADKQTPGMGGFTLDMYDYYKNNTIVE